MYIQIFNSIIQLHQSDFTIISVLELIGIEFLSVTMSCFPPLQMSDSWSYPPLNDAADVAARVCEALAQRGWRLG